MKTWWCDGCRGGFEANVDPWCCGSPMREVELVTVGSTEYHIIMASRGAWSPREGEMVVGYIDGWMGKGTGPYIQSPEGKHAIGDNRHMIYYDRVEPMEETP